MQPCDTLPTVIIRALFLGRKLCCTLELQQLRFCISLVFRVAHIIVISVCNLVEADHNNLTLFYPYVIFTH